MRPSCKISMSVALAAVTMALGFHPACGQPRPDYNRRDGYYESRSPPPRRHREWAEHDYYRRYPYRYYEPPHIVYSPPLIYQPPPPVHVYPQAGISFFIPLNIY